MNPAPIFDRAYPVIKRRILRGDWRPNERIDAGLLARDLDTSPIPVREALQRLVGEQLVELVQGGGFAMPHLTEGALRDLYSWHGQLLRIAMRHRADGLSVASAVPPDVDTAEDLACAAEVIFGTIGQASDNVEHFRALVSVGERLRAVRICESQLISNVETEVAAVRSLTADGREDALRDAISAYQRRRLRRIPQLAAALQTFERPLVA